MGDQYVYLSSTGIKISNPKAEFALVSHAPEWLITLYNTKTRCFYQTPIDKWKRDLQARGLTYDVHLKNWNKKGAGQICGLKAIEYVSPNSSTFQGQTRMHTLANADYWTSKDINVPPRLADLITTAYGLPTSSTVPLRLNCTDNGEPKVMLDTYYAKQTAIPVSYFEPPAGLTRVKTDAEVMMDDDQKQLVNDMVEQLNNDTQASAGSTVKLGKYTLPKEKVQKLLDSLKSK